MINRRRDRLTCSCRQTVINILIFRDTVTEKRNRPTNTVIERGTVTEKGSATDTDRKTVTEKEREPRSLWS